MFLLRLCVLYIATRDVALPNNVDSLQMPSASAAAPIKYPVVLTDAGAVSAESGKSARSPQILPKLGFKDL